MLSSLLKGHETATRALVQPLCLKTHVRKALAVFETVVVMSVNLGNLPPTSWGHPVPPHLSGTPLNRAVGSRQRTRSDKGCKGI